MHNLCFCTLYKLPGGKSHNWINQCPSAWSKFIAWTRDGSIPVFQNWYNIDIFYWKYRRYRYIGNIFYF